MLIQETAIEEIHHTMIRTLCRKASHIEAFYSGARVRIELTADRIKAFVFCPRDDWQLFIARPTGRYTDQQFMSYATQIAALAGLKYCIYDCQQMTYTFKLGLTRIVLSGPMSSLW